MLKIFLLVLPIFLVLAAGSILMRLKLLNQEFIVTGNRLIFNFLLPTLLIAEIAESDFSRLFRAVDVMVMVAAVVTIFFVSFGLARLLKLSGQAAGTFVMDNFRSNYAYIGLPVCFLVFGKEGMAAGGILMAFIVPVVNMISIMALNMGNGEKFALPRFLKDTLWNPLVVACFVGIALAVLQVDFPAFIDQTLDIISGATLPLALFSIGATLDFRRLQGSYSLIGVSVLCKLFLLPLIAYFYLWVLQVPLGITEKVMLLMLASPAATVNYILASAMHGDADLASGTIIATTVCSMFSYMAWVGFLGM